MPRTSLVSDASREERELREYLGEEFELARLQQYERSLADEFAACGDEARFYRVSRGYLYNLTAFAMTDTKLPYLNELVGLVAPGSRLLDYGCGIGSDGLLLLEAGYRVEFADFSNPSTEYLRWRLRRRGLEAPVHDLDGEVPGASTPRSPSTSSSTSMTPSPSWPRWSSARASSRSTCSSRATTIPSYIARCRSPRSSAAPSACDCSATASSTAARTWSPTGARRGGLRLALRGRCG